MLFHCLLACIASDDKLVAVFIVIFLCASPYPALLAAFNSLSLDFRSLSVCLWVVFFILFFLWIDGLPGSVSWFSEQIGKKFICYLISMTFFHFLLYFWNSDSMYIRPLNIVLLVFWALYIFFSLFSPCASIYMDQSYNSLIRSFLQLIDLGYCVSSSKISIRILFLNFPGCYWNSSSLFSLSPSFPLVFFLNIFIIVILKFLPSTCNTKVICVSVLIWVIFLLSVNQIFPFLCMKFFTMS